MANPEINVDPERIKNLALELRLCANSLQTDLFLMEESLGRLGKTWKDDESVEFRNKFRMILAKLKLLVDTIRLSESDMNADAALLADYLRTQLQE